MLDSFPFEWPEHAVTEIFKIIVLTRLLFSFLFSTDHIYDETRSTLELFNECARPIISETIRGFNGTIFAYGQTSSGKVSMIT